MTPKLKWFACVDTWTEEFETDNLEPTLADLHVRLSRPFILRASLIVAIEIKTGRTHIVKSRHGSVGVVI